jgi:prolyl-tRNA editing enzyme YbaK/EbsC (Cys-tRNA(Pro) deacylase)
MSPPSEPRAPAVERFTEAATALGIDVEVVRFPEGTKTAADAARAVGCEIGQIVKSLVFMADGRPVVALTSGSNRADTARLAELMGAAEVRRATPDEARAATGFAIGGTPPFGYPGVVEQVIDQDLMDHAEVWAAAGTPDAVWRVDPERLRAATGARVERFGLPG